MSGFIAAFVVIDLPRPITVHAKANTKRSRSTADLQALLQSNCRLMLSKRVANRFQIYLQFDSLRDCILAVGGFARSQNLRKSQSQLIRVGISLGEIPAELTDSEIPAHTKARWLTGITSQSAVFMSESAAAVANDLDILPYAVEEFGEFFNIQSGQLSRVYWLAHPQLSLLEKVEDDRPKHNIPWPAEFFIGREADIETIGGMLEQVRYVRLIGASGVGKSTLARRMGLEVLDHFRDGIKYADLSKVTSRSGLLTQIFKSIDFPIEQADELNLELVRKHFGGKHHLIILDGCENIEGHVEQVVNALLKTGRVQILSTSIQSADSAYGADYLVEDLPVPAINEVACLADIEGIDACALFIDGMRKFRQGLPPQDSEAATIFQLCRCTGGSPLALNLAARRLKFEPLQSVLENYHASSSNPQLNASVTRTLDQLPASSRQVIEFASAFAGTWTKAQLAALMDRKPNSLYEDIHTLQILGLVKEEPDTRGRGRFVLSNHFRSGIRAILQQESRLDKIRERHLLLVLDTCRISIQEMNGPDQRRHLDFLDGVAEDLETALEFLINFRPSIDDFIEAMRSTWLYWFKRNRLLAVVTLADQGLARFGSQDPIGAARLKMLKAIFLSKFGKTKAAISLLAEALESIDQAQEPNLYGQLQINLGIAYWGEDRPLDAANAYRLSLDIAKQLDNKSLVVSALTGLSATYISFDDPVQAVTVHKQFKQAAHDSTDFLDRWNILMGDVQIAWSAGDYLAASQLIEKCMDEAREGGDTALVSRTFLWKAQVEASAGQMENAATSLGSCVSIMNSNEHNFNRSNIRRIKEIEECIAARLGNQAMNQFKLAGSLVGENWL